ncbi:MAG: SH3 domain-containing protein [Pseudomonadota bacterium]
MRKLLIIIIILIGIASILHARAAQTKPEKVVVNLYAKPDKSAKVVKAINPKQRMIPIYREKGWTKIGLPQDGQVGWINNQAYDSAIDKLYQNQTQMVFVQMSDNNQQKPEATIVAYRNGKKLSDKEAKAIYAKVQKQQAQYNQQMQRLQKHMNLMYMRDMQAFNQMVRPMMPAMEPVIVINQPAATTTNKETADNKQTSNH